MILAEDREGNSILIEWVTRLHGVNILCIDVFLLLLLFFSYSFAYFFSFCFSSALLRVRAMSAKRELNLSMKQKIFSTFLMLPL